MAFSQHEGSAEHMLESQSSPFFLSSVPWFPYLKMGIIIVPHRAVVNIKCIGTCKVLRRCLALSKHQVQGDLVFIIIFMIIISGSF